MNTKSLLNKLSKKYPKKYAKMNHDHVGLMVGKLPNEINKIVLCLDLDEEILDEVIKINPDIIITHHPFIFGTRAKVLKNDLKKAKIYSAIENANVPVYSFHTNFDTGKDGMNDALAEALGLQNIYAPQYDIMMRVGYLPKPMDIHDFAKKANIDLDIKYSLLVNGGTQTINKVGIIGGGGSRSWKVAQLEGCDIYISGDAPHYVRRDIITSNYNYLDMPHEIEHIFMKQMKKVLLNFDNTLKIIALDHEKIPEVIS